jgi:predicted DCC family thiol-disulfide oxidoreductase YuxK
MSRSALVVWFDGSCPLCRKEIALIKRLDRRGAIEFIDVALDDTICPIDRGELLRRFHAQERDGPMLSGASAFAAMWRTVPLLRPLGLIGLWPPALWVLELAYRGFLKVRPALQKAVRYSARPTC